MDLLAGAMGILLGGAGCLLSLFFYGLFIVLALTVFAFVTGGLFGGDDDADDDLELRRWATSVCAPLLAVPDLEEALAAAVSDASTAEQLSSRLSEVYGEQASALHLARETIDDFNPPSEARATHEALVEQMAESAQGFEDLTRELRTQRLDRSAIVAALTRAQARFEESFEALNRAFDDEPAPSLALAEAGCRE